VDCLAAARLHVQQQAKPRSLGEQTIALFSLKPRVVAHQEQEKDKGNRKELKKNSLLSSN
jgi:hypothetical protein